MIFSADKNKFSPPEMNVIKGIKSDIPLVLVTRLDDFVFNEELRELKEWVMIDLCEYGWDAPDFIDTHLFGKNTEEYWWRFGSDEWRRFDGWVGSNPPKLYFKRELLKKDITDTILPIDYPSYIRVENPMTKEQYNARPINAFHFFGRSHEDRIKAHCDFWLSGAAVCDNIYYINNFIQKEESGNKWVSLHIPHYERIDISNILAVNNLSKLSLSMAGSGKKCYRHSESSINSLMVLEKTNMAWQFDWVDGKNCFEYISNPVSTIKKALSEPEKLYDIYCAGIENARNYQIDNYTRHLEKIING